MADSTKTDLNGAEIAALIDRSKQLVHQNYKKGLLERNENGLYSLLSLKNQSFLRSKGVDLSKILPGFNGPQKIKIKGNGEEHNETRNADFYEYVTTDGSTHLDSNLTENADQFGDNPDRIPRDILEARKIHEQTRKEKIQNAERLNQLCETEMVRQVLGEIGQCLRNNFVDIPRREAALLSAKWGVPERERDIQMDLENIIKTGIQAMKSDLGRFLTSDILTIKKEEKHDQS